MSVAQTAFSPIDPSAAVLMPETIGRAAQVFRAAQVLADTLAVEEAPRSSRDAVRQLASAGLLVVPLPVRLGGLGWGIEQGGQASLLRLLSIVGGGDLSLGRLYEGHVNALILIMRYGTADQQARWAADAADGLLFGVWNTGQPELLRLVGGPATYCFQGGKSFASGAAFVTRPIVTAELAGGGWQMTIPRMDAPAMARRVTIDPGSWQPLGMEGSESYTVDFTGGELPAEDLLGAPGDFYQDPLFRGGAIRFAAVQAGAVLRLHRMFAEWLAARGRGEDPYQLARLAEIALGAQEAVLWIERAAEVAEQALAPDAEKRAVERMVECANMTRLAIERIATANMPRIIAGIGAHGLLRPHHFERILRDLTMYLRQPAPDATLADVGRAALRKSSLFVAGANSGFWGDDAAEGCMAPAYFDRLYGQSADPWSFETSAYEAAKYRDTLDSLPRLRYRNALEIGCSIGVLTEQLAQRVEALLSIDVSERALATARRRCSSLPQVRFAQMQVPADMPDAMPDGHFEGHFDLIVISEVAYYWDRDTLLQAASLLAARQHAGDHLLLVHHTPWVPDYPLTGDQVHALWLARPEWILVESRRREGYRIDLLERTA